MDLQSLVVLGFVVESCGESIWWLFNGEWNKERILALVLGGVLAAATGLNLLEAAGLQPASYLPPVAWLVLGEVCTALVGMRGATFVNDFLTGVQAWRANSVK